MSSASKALALLSHFSVQRPEIGLSQLCRIAKRDKATTYRHLQALEEAGFIEQNPATKHYRLGPAVMHLAQVREATVPRKESAKSVLSVLADATGETSHVAVLSGTTVYGLCDCESPRHATRAVLDINTFPLHATASGLCALAFGGDDLLEAALKRMESFTASTLTSKSDIEASLDTVRETGFAQANRSYEDEIQGIAAPIFDHTGALAGTVAVASVASRFSAELERVIKAELIVAARALTHNWGGTVPAHIEAAWAKSVSRLHELESTS
ncbi:HTH-type transcriptional regulator, IclR family [Sulfitobacter noctilucicola]|uniref:DNA-binding IclR family transcriptional regulator n=1 Tax=Sulfitobacter noctilucicola TaxID=1342301 RepID=A0A7W6M5H0_9RHOB|nr:IclR family transcriptional regulator [Sulfitobacter noctilucicola]KIN62698.1 HTH-type transcriptional regulator, IclR family [Sulfitobacter noctilucicola]MBB4172769.1 DNA-binding IclR family transcriptional regulator [Sulfitobacter noctilucicola]